MARTPRWTAVGGGAVLMVDADGGIAAAHLTGLYIGDRRALSLLRIGVDGHDRETLRSATPTPDQFVTHALLTDRAGRRRALLSDVRRVDGGLTVTLTVRALAGAGTYTLTAEVASDRADLLTLRYGDRPPPPVPYDRADGALVVCGDAPTVTIDAPGATLDAAGRVRWTLAVPRGASRTAVLHVRGDAATPPPSAPSTPLEVTGDHRWRRAVASALADLAALRMHDPARGLRWIGAGAPWYMALFGRDALLTAYETLIAGTDDALDALEALARFQGTRDDPATGEAPGKILHELRTGHSGVFGLLPWRPYYGSVDASALFVVLLAEAWRWGADVTRITALLPAARRAVAWCRATAARDTDGLITYDADVGGLANQGWKDSADAMVHADGTVAPPPIAVVEAQGYHWRAVRDLADLERAIGDREQAAVLRADAAALRRRLVTAFASHPGCVVAMARDGRGRPLAVASSNAGHLLWVGALDERDATALCDRLGADDMDAGWGLRTLSRDATGYDPLSYHRGSVWPHDTALVIDGLARAGGRATAARLVDGVLDLAEHGGWRLPELVAGYGSDEVATPVPYPTTCEPQAWSAAVPLALLRTLLRIDPDVPAGAVTVGPALRDDVTLQVTGIRLGAHRLDVSLDAGRITARADPPLEITVRD